MSLTPGSDAKRARAEQQARDAVAAWSQGQPPALSDQPTATYKPGVLPGQADATVDVQPGNIQQFQTGDAVSAPQESYLTPGIASLMGLPGQSAAAGKTSAYGDLGPSGFQDATTAFGALGPSAGTNLGFNKQNLSQMGEAGDYFRKLTKTGSDPIAEADYQKRAMQAEQSRKQNEDAALASMEAKGLGNAGGQLAARTGGIQDAANSRYQAGLDATANAAQRRDTAATAGAGIASKMGENQLLGDAMRAAAVDKYNQARAAGIDDFSAKRASGLDQFDTAVAGGKDTFSANQNNALDAFGNQRYADWYATQKSNADRGFTANQMNTQRGWTVGDTNTATHNALPQQNFNNWLAVTGGKSNALLGAGSQTASGATASGLGVIPEVIQAGANTATAIGQASQGAPKKPLL